jgi:TetR/AcrR family transcriptional regulator of autoinduction and epiphytic fitness
MAAAAKRAVDPRIERSRQVILAAALAELGEIGFGAFTIESVAARAGVGKSTIYRHWPDRLALIADAFKTLHQEGGPDLSRGTPREKLERILRHVADVVADSPFGVCLPALIDAAERDAALRRFHHQFQAEARKPVVALIASGIASGDFPPHLDAELAAVALLGAIFFRRLMTAAPFDPAQAGALIDTVIGAAA